MDQNEPNAGGIPLFVLTGRDKWSDWEVCLIMNLRRIDALRYVQNDVPVPVPGPTVSQADVKEDTNLRTAATTMMMLKISPSLRQTILSRGVTKYENNPHTIFKAIESAVLRTGNEGISDLCRKAYNTTSRNTKDLRELVYKIVDIECQIKASCKPEEFMDAYILSVLLNGIREDHEVWYDLLKRDTDKLGPKEAKEEAITFIHKKADQMETLGGFANLTVKEKGPREREDPKKTRPQKGTNNKGKSGKDEKSRDKPPPCPRCPGRKHHEADCWVLHPGKKAEYLRKQLVDLGEEPATGRDAGDINITTAGSNWATMAADLTSLATVASSDIAILDSGCSNTTFNNVKWFDTILYKKIDTGMKSATGSNLQADGVGTVKTTTIDGSEMTFENCYYCPGSIANLISMGKLKAQGIIFDGSDDSLKYKKSAKKLFEVSWINGADVSVINLKPPILSGVALAALPVNGPKRQKVDFDLMHKRLMHAGPDRVIKACKEAGINLDLDSLKNYHCEACYLGKSTPVISHTPTYKVTQLLQKISWDVIQSNPVGINGIRYCLHGIDYYTGFQWSIMATTRQQLFARIIAWRGQVETLSGGYKVQTLLVDGAGELNTKEFKEWCDKSHIKLLTSAPRAHQQNGRSEKAGDKLMTMARTACIDNGLPPFLWPYYIQTATSTENLLPTSSNEGMESPLKKLFRTIKVDWVPYLRHLRTFGCTAYVHISSEVRAKGDKMAPRAKKGFLVGYEGYHGHVYQIWIPQEHKVIRVRDARFWDKLVDDPTNQAQDLPVAEFVDPDISDGYKNPTLDSVLEPFRHGKMDEAKPKDSDQDTDQGSK